MLKKITPPSWAAGIRPKMPIDSRISKCCQNEAQGPPKPPKNLPKRVPKAPLRAQCTVLKGKVEPYENLAIRVWIACGALLGNPLVQQKVLINGSVALIAIRPPNNDIKIAKSIANGAPRVSQWGPKINKKSLKVGLWSPLAPKGPAGMSPGRIHCKGLRFWSCARGNSCPEHRVNTLYCFTGLQTKRPG